MKYKVMIQKQEFHTITVEADSETEAKDIASKQLLRNIPKWLPTKLIYKGVYEV